MDSNKALPCLLAAFSSRATQWFGCFDDEAQTHFLQSARLTTCERCSAFFGYSVQFT